MLCSRRGSSARGRVKSQRNSKELPKPAGAGRAEGMSSSKRRPLTSREAEGTAYDIGPFRLDPEAGVLTRLGIAEPLGPRAVAVLAVLVKNAHQPVTKDALMDAAWPGLVVEEANLSVQMSSIRRVLAQVPGGERWIETLARRGYRFIGPVMQLRDGQPQTTASDRSGNLPESLTSFIGRDRELVELKRLLSRTRLLTLTGAGGIGKTRLAVQLAVEVKDAYRDQVWFIDFAPLNDSDLVPNAVAQVLGVQQSAGKPLAEALSRHVKGRRLLLIFDNCEHVLDASARLTELMLRGAAEPTIIATSREPLRIAGEQTYRLAALSIPPPEANVELIRQSEAVRLFVDRARHQCPEFAFTEAQAPAVAQLCIRLDGIPFALELTAARIRAYSVDEINARLDDRFALLTDGNRTALPRQQTLHATLDWSYDLLPEAERSVMRRLSVFSGGFTLEAATAVVSDPMLDATVADSLLGLVARSLVVADATDGRTRYRLLETMRAYAREKMDIAREAAAVQRRHAEYVRELFMRSGEDWLRLSEAAWRSRYFPEVDNVRSALDWSVGRDGDAAIAVGLAGASGRLWTMLSLYGEGIKRLEAAFARLGSSTEPADEARLLLELGSLLEPAEPTRALAAFEKSIALYERLQDATSLGVARIWLARVMCTLGRLDCGAELLTKALPPLLRLRVPKLLGIHASNAAFLAMAQGNTDEARRQYEKALSHFRQSGHEFGIVANMGNLANVCWATGDLSAAEEAFREAIAMWRESHSGKTNALGFALANLAGVLTERGEHAAALVVAREGLPMLNDIGSAWLFMDHLALRAALAGHLANAARVAGFADGAYAAKKAAREPNEARARERVRGLLRERFAAHELDRLFADGRKMSDAEACRVALDG
jgi:predicted ATPase/DNA-binding winged helix-turn-helix (wHTH) protein